MNSDSGNDKVFIERLTSIVDANLGDENFGVRELAEKMRMNRSNIHRKLKSITKKSVSEFIREIRLRKAKQLLEEGSDNVSEIAYHVGFGSPSYFGRCFHEYYGYAPGEVKKGIHPESQIKTKAGKSFSREIRIPALIALSVLFAVLLLWAGTHFISEKPSRGEISIAILPFDNLSEIDNTRFLGDGIMEDLLNRLSTLKDVRVISRTSSEMFRDKGDETIPEIGKILGATHIVEGTVQREENKLRISVQLIDTKTDDHILSKQYNRNLGSFFEVQSEIAEEIASELSLVLTNAETLALQENLTQNLKALEYYQQGRFHSSKRTVENFKKGIEYYEKAIEEDPGFAKAYAGLADNYHLLVYCSSEGLEVRKINAPENIQKAYEMVQKALELNPNLAEAYTVLGDMDGYFDNNWEKAEKELRRAIDLNPNFSTAHQYYAEILTHMGKLEEAGKHINKAVQLDPFSVVIRFISARNYYFLEQYNKARSEIEICFDLDQSETHFSWMDLAVRIYTAGGDDLDALDIIKKIGALSGPWTQEEADSIYCISGVGGLDIWIIETFDYLSFCTKAYIYALTGEYEKALDNLEQADEANELDALSFLEPQFKKLRSEPRFIDLQEKYKVSSTPT
ncbi:MAG TPA: helix-turn-helix domain-containing protein [Draconibacterium sp.]|nr:helix-turn-helix domain-containing protein [Draconibacterium sp.]